VRFRVSVLEARKRHQAFGRGTITFLYPSNQRVLAFIRRYGDEQLLVVTNLSRFVQYVELDMSAHRGLVPVEILTAQGRVVGAELTAPQPLKRLSQVNVEQAAACLSLSASEVKTDRHPPQIISVGLSFLAVELASRDALRRARPDAAAFAETFPRDDSDAVYLYTRDVPADEKPCELQARMFHPGASGLSEDPATGSATAAAAALLADLDPMKNGELKLRIGQGVDMGRPSLLLTRVRKHNGAVASIHVGGSCVQMMEGTFRLAGEGA
jgi:trans-2,3-dihydro-3-hydroxyanthranilate isomerase